MTGAKKILQWAKGFRGRAKNCISIARERVEKGLQYAYRDRRNMKRDMRSLWIQRINAGAREHGVRAACLCACVACMHAAARQPSCASRHTPLAHANPNAAQTWLLHSSSTRS